LSPAPGPVERAALRGGRAPAPGAGGELLARLRRTGALLEGHFHLSSGLHSPVYFQSALLLQHPREAEWAAGRLARRVRAALRRGAPGEGPPVVVSPALGGIVIGHELARALGGRGIFAERREGRLELRRGFRLEPGEPVVVCEDVVTTGASAREVAELVAQAGASVRLAAALVHRGDEERAGLDVPLVALARLRAPAHAPGDCPQCAAGLPLDKPGSRTGQAVAPDARGAGRGGTKPTARK
jgi:orotate phosphoribosyltransferase